MYIGLQRATIHFFAGADLRELTQPNPCPQNSTKRARSFFFPPMITFGCRQVDDLMKAIRPVEPSR